MTDRTNGAHLGAPGMRVLWTAQTRNSKTGNVPTAWIGDSEAAARASCAGCPLLESGACYAHAGTVAMGARSVYRAHKRGKAYDLGTALAGRLASARMVRVSAIGDAGRMPLDDARALQARIRREGLALVGYTHHHREPAVRDAWRGHLMASCESERDAEDAVRDGWRATMLVGADDTRRAWRTARDGAKVVTCPAQTHGSTCNDCRLCEASREHLAPIVAFRVHGPTSRAEETLRRAEALASDLVSLASS